MDKRYAFEEVTFVHFLEFFSGFAYDINMRFRPGRRGGTDLLRRPPGGKTCRVRKPPVFIRFDVPPPGGLLLPLRVNSPCRRQSRNKFKGPRPLNNPKDSKKERHLPLLLCCRLLFDCVYRHISDGVGDVAPQHLNVCPGAAGGVAPNHHPVAGVQVKDLCAGGAGRGVDPRLVVG